MSLPPRLTKFVMNLWPPFLSPGIRVKRIAPDWREVTVELKLGLLNRNYVGTHFGGSLYAMTDPFYMLMLISNLGRDYIVWDQSGRIDYRKPGRGKVQARFTLDDAQLDEIRRRTSAGDKYLPQLSVQVLDEAGEVVANVYKTLYVRLKPHRRPAPETVSN
jgi:acyl-coenzyme A thioesterase PaaI-like protein